MLNAKSILFSAAVLALASSPAYAQNADAGGAMLGQFLPLILLLAVFWFLLIRPQQKKVREHKAMISALKKGDKVVTAGGILGTINKVEDTEVVLQVADKVEIRVVRSMITDTADKLKADVVPANTSNKNKNKKAA